MEPQFGMLSKGMQALMQQTCEGKLQCMNDPRHVKLCPRVTSHAQKSLDSPNNEI